MRPMTDRFEYDRYTRELVARPNRQAAKTPTEISNHNYARGEHYKALLAELSEAVLRSNPSNKKLRDLAAKCLGETAEVSE